jgi:hypothetical protein
MLEVISVLENTIIRTQCDPALYNSDDLKLHVDRVFEDPRVATDLGEGKVLSTYGIDSIDITTTQGITPLIDWITDQILKSANILGYSDVDTVNLVNVFTNKMWPDSLGKVHYHKEIFHGIAIFYFHQPNAGSDLYIVSDGFIGATEKDFAADKIHYLNVKQGELVIHSPTTWHGVTKNTSSEERIVLVFEFRYEPALARQ